MSPTSASVPHRRVSKWFKGFGILAVLAIMLGGLGIALASGKGLIIGSLTPRTLVVTASALPYKTASGEKEKPPLVFYDGICAHKLFCHRDLFTQVSPKVFLVFWGPKWKSDTSAVKKITNTFKALSGSSYNGILGQYVGKHFVNEITVTDVIDSSTPPSNIDIGFETTVGIIFHGQVRHEADKEISQHHWSVNRNDQIIVFPQKGSTYNHGGNFCGVHAYNSTAAHPYAYGLVQYGDKNHGCNFVGNTTDDIIWDAVHEYAETVTDPQIFATATINPPFYTALSTGWHTKDSSKTTPQEVADLCSGYFPTSNSSLSYFHANGVPVPYLWSNRAKGCVK
jgi:hypothetical protein